MYGSTGKVIPFAVGVGSYNIHQLRMIANGNQPRNSMSRVLTVSSFDQLQNVLSSLTSSITSAVGLEGNIYGYCNMIFVHSWGAQVA